MVNSLVFMGRIENFCEEKNGIKLLISHHTEDGTFVAPVYTNFKPKKEVLDILEEDMLIAIKGHISLDKKNQVIIVADKISMLTSKKVEGENNESK